MWARRSGLWAPGSCSSRRLRAPLLRRHSPLLRLLGWPRYSAAPPLKLLGRRHSPARAKLRPLDGSRSGPHSGSPILLAANTHEFREFRDIYHPWQS